MEKIKTGVQGLDEVLEGGILSTSSVLLAGVPGTGKTLFGMQYILQGALEGQPGLFISYEELESTIVKHAHNFGLDFTTHIKKGLITVVNQEISGKLISFRAVLDLMQKRNIKRVFLDSITLFEYIIFDKKADFRKEVLEFTRALKKLGITLLATSEKKETDIDNIAYNPEDFLFEGLIHLTKIRKGASFERCLSVAKMRGQSHMMGIYPFTINEEGIIIYPKQIPFSLIEKDS